MASESLDFLASFINLLYFTVVFRELLYEEEIVGGGGKCRVFCGAAKARRVVFPLGLMGCILPLINLMRQALSSS